MRARVHTTLALLLLLPATALAALGEGRASIEADRRALGGAPGTATAHSAYTVESFDLHGTTVREYVRPDGLVFAVAWEGLTHPDLTTILGQHAGEWRAALAAAPTSGGSRSHRRVEAGATVVETWGHMRHLGGRAILTTLVPPNVRDDEIR